MTTREKWDVGRFLQTLAYYRIVPFLGNSWLPQWLNATVSYNNKNAPVVLVVGATGGVGKRLVNKLSRQGYRVRSLVRDKPKALMMFGKAADIIDADLTLPETLTPNIMQDVKQIICATGTRVQPIEGDTPNREKYYQGIKFYMPEVVDIPEKVEYEGMKNLLNLAKPYLKGEDSQMIFDFTNPNQDLAEIWGILDDVVMGGASASNISLIDTGAVFAGNVSTANSGGFVSVRSRNFSQAMNLTGYEGIELRVKGDGKRYKFIIRGESRWDGIGYCYSFDTVANIWQTVRIPFQKLIPVFRAKTLPDMPVFNSQAVYSCQLMLSKFEYDGELNPRFSAGAFRLDVEYIKAYGGNSLPKFVLISSAGVTRPGRPGLNLAEEPPAVRLNDQLGGILTWKLRGEDEVRNSGLPYTIIRPCAMTEEAGGKNLIFAQGDNIRGRVSRDDIAELCLQVLAQPLAANKTFEVKQDDYNNSRPNWSELFSRLQADP